MELRYVSISHGDIVMPISPRMISFNDVIDFFISILYGMDPTTSYREIEKNVTLSTSSGIYIGNIIPFNTRIEEVFKNSDSELVITRECNSFVRENYTFDEFKFVDTMEYNELSYNLRLIERTSLENRSVLTRLINSRYNTNGRPFSSLSNDVPASLLRNPYSVLNNAGIILFDDLEVQVLSQEEFNKLPVRIQNSQSEGEGYEDICVICQSNYEEDDEIVKLPCEHEYHRECAKSWLTQNSCKCPTCRYVITGTSINNIEVEHII